MNQVNERSVPPPTLLPYRVRVAGRMKDNPRHASPGTWHDDAMLLVFISGRGVYRVKKHERKVVAPLLGIVLPEAPRGILMADGQTPYDHIYCRFSGDLALETSRRIVESMKTPPFTMITDDWTRIVEVAKNIVKLQYSDGARTADATAERVRPVDAELAKLLAILDCAGIPPEHGLTLERIRTYVRRRVSSPSDLGSMAAYFNVSKEYLCRRTRQLTGSSPMQLLNHEKMLWARELIEHGGITVAEVAERVGFADANYFSKAFKKHFGQPPTCLGGKGELS